MIRIKIHASPRSDLQSAEISQSRIENSICYREYQALDRFRCLWRTSNAAFPI